MMTTMQVSHLPNISLEHINLEIPIAVATTQDAYEILVVPPLLNERRVMIHLEVAEHRVGVPSLCAA